jgi:type VI secretion system protein ImpC
MSEQTGLQQDKINEVVDAPSLLDSVIAKTPQTDRSRAEELIRTLAEEALKGTVTFDRSISITIRDAVAKIDEAMSKQLAAIMHHPDVQKLEGSWRGLFYLVMQSETGPLLKLKVMNASKRELFEDLDKAEDFDRSQLFTKIYTNEIGMPGGEPYASLIGDFEFTNHPEDIELLRKTANVSASAFAPFISAAAPSLMGLKSWADLNKPRDVSEIFDTEEYIKWRSYRDTEDSRFVALVLPRVLSRLPYGANTKPVEEFHYEEGPIDKAGNSLPMPHDHYTWMNAAYALGARLTDAFAKFGWCTAIRGFDGGGKVENLPTHLFKSDKGDTMVKCPTEVLIPERRDYEFAKAGFLPLCNYKNTDYSVFFSGQTTQKPKKYDRPAANANAAISARLPYILATSRFAHCLKIMGRNMIGDFWEANEVENRLNRWILNYVNANADGGREMKARYPLQAAKVEVKEIPGEPGAYNAVAWMRPWLQLEELTASMSMVARIPGKNG